MSTNHHILLAKYFGGTASKEEMLALDEWIAASKENDDYFIETSKIYGKIGLPTNTPTPKKSIAKTALKEHLQSSKTNSKNYTQKKQSFTISRTQWMVAASIVILFSLSVGVYNYFTPKEYVFTSNDVAQKNILPDDTRIELACKSQVIFSEKSTDNLKHIKLNGKATFDISKKSSGKVLIDIENKVFIKDIGTTFTVCAYKECDKIEVSVKDGCVNFYTNTNKGLKLTKNQKGIFNKTTQQFTLVENYTQTTASTSQKKESKFKNKVFKLIDLINSINKEYKTKIILKDKALENEEISVSFNENESVDLMIQVIAETMDLKILKEGDTIILAKK